MITKKINEAKENNALIIGTNKTLKALKNGEAKQVYIASNAKKEVLEDVEYYADLNDTTYEQLTVNNKELGNMCKKPFNIQLIATR